MDRLRRRSAATVTALQLRLLGGVDPTLIDTAERALSEVSGVDRVRALRMRRLCHRLLVEAEVVPDDAVGIDDLAAVAETATVRLRKVLPGGATLTLIPVAPQRVVQP